MTIPSFESLVKQDKAISAITSQEVCMQSFSGTIEEELMVSEDEIQYENLWQENEFN